MLTRRRSLLALLAFGGLLVLGTGIGVGVVAASRLLPGSTAAKQPSGVSSPSPLASPSPSAEQQEPSPSAPVVIVQTPVQVAPAPKAPSAQPAAKAHFVLVTADWRRSGANSGSADTAHAIFKNDGAGAGNAVVNLSCAACEPGYTTTLPITPPNAFADVTSTPSSRFGGYNNECPQRGNCAPPVVTISNP